MNKLIIAGNGFDLAHGLPTSYNNFMDAFWRDLQENQDDELVKEVVYLNSEFQNHFNEGEVTNFKTFEANIHKYLKRNFKIYKLDEYWFSQLMGNNYNNKTVLFKFKNSFFHELNYIKSIQNWVDVENEYYRVLKFICKDEEIDIKQKRTQILELNKEFEQVKQLLEKYLQKNVTEAYNFSISDNNSIWEMLKPYQKSDANEKLVDEFSVKADKDKIKDLMDWRVRKSIFDKELITHILNFNYTPTFEKYISLSRLGEFSIPINYIHGKLTKDIVFGFGDEMDEDYKLIENMDDNEYLRYFKSFQYVQNSNYKDVLRYIDSEKFQVIILGHSCGLSDRTLLNTIFEHENCRSIKVFYYKNGDYDNYTEIIQNISRHFNDKKLMRTKIVEKTLCEPMPQMQLPKKES